MIRIELFDHRNRLLKSLDSSEGIIRVGRALDSDIIVPDFAVDSTEAVIEKTGDDTYRVSGHNRVADFESAHHFKLRHYSLRLTNLKYFAENNPATQMQRNRHWYRSLAIYVLLLFMILFSAWISLPDEPGSTLLSGLMAFNFVYFAFLLGAAVLSKIVNGEYKLLQLAEIFTGALLAYTVLDDSGIRWALPAVFGTNLLWYVVLLVPLFFFYRAFVQELFESLGSRIKAFILLAPFLAGTAALLLYFFPYQNRYRYLTFEVKPPVFEILESKPVDPSVFLQDLDAFID